MSLRCDVCARTWYESEAEVCRLVRSPAFCDRPVTRKSVRDADGTDRGAEPCPWKTST